MTQEMTLSAAHHWTTPTPNLLDRKQPAHLADVAGAVQRLVAFWETHSEARFVEMLRAATPAQIETLRTYCSKAGTFDETARILGVEEPAVRRRMARLRLLTGLAHLAQAAFALGVADRLGIELSREADRYELLVQEPTLLYRHFDAAGRLLYVGIAAKRAYKHRCASHALSSSWWPVVVASTIEEFPDRPSAAKAEAAAIRRDRPIYNIAHNR